MIWRPILRMSHAPMNTPNAVQGHVCPILAQHPYLLGDVPISRVQDKICPGTTRQFEPLWRQVDGDDSSGVRQLGPHYHEQAHEPAAHHDYGLAMDDSRPARPVDTRTPPYTKRCEIPVNVIRYLHRRTFAEQAPAGNDVLLMVSHRHHPVSR